MIFSPGKLLLTSEYVVLDGASALALPTKWGQEFFVEEFTDGKSLVYWDALHRKTPWLNATIDYKNEVVLQSNIPESATFILKVLKEIKRVSNSQLQKDSSYKISTNLQFPADYGLGSSSTLMNNLAVWAKIDAFNLNENCLGGSGYDIAVAQEKSAIVYQNRKQRIVEKVLFAPKFKEEIIFIHLNQKQNSREGISLYHSKQKSPQIIDAFSDLTKQVLEASDLTTFSHLMSLHEQMIGELIEVKPIKETAFPDCPTFVKSLGAWGGDFVMSTTFPGYRNYFQHKGYSTIFSFDDLIA